MAVPACPFPVQPKRPRCHQCSSVCVLPPCLPQGPSRALGVQLEVGGQRGPGGAAAPAPPGCAAGKAVLSQQGLQSWSDRAGGGSGPLVVLGVVAGCHQGCQRSCSWAEQFLPGQDLLPSCGSCDPAVTLCGAGLLQTWLWMGTVWGFQPFSLQPQELLYCWGEAGPAPPPCPACHSLRSLDSMIVRLCAPSLTL